MPQPFNEDEISVVLTFQDSDGQEWLAGAVMTPLRRYDGEALAEEFPVAQMPDRAFMLVDFKVVTGGPAVT